MGVIYIRNKDGALVPFSSSDNCVKTVNGVEPDESGNIQIIIPDSGGNADYLDETEALELLSETGIIEPMTDSNGAFYTTTENTIYVF